MKSLTDRLASLQEELAKVKTYVPTTLFDLSPNWELVKQGRCAICGSKLRVPEGKKIAYCAGKRHPDKRKFVIKISKLYEIKSMAKKVA